MKTFKILGLLLAYPKPEIIDHLDEMIAVLAQENLLPKRALKKVTAFARSLQGRDIYEIQED